MRRRIVWVLIGSVACMAAATASASATTTVTRHVGPIAGKQRAGRHQVYSTNWSGYVAHDDTFKSATGSWQMPTADCSKVKGQKETVATFFVGLDGFDSGTVEQTGVDAICLGKTAYYLPWYEFYPDRAFFSDELTATPGDTLTATVTHSGNSVTTTLTDQGKWTYSSPAQSDSGLLFNSADWITESPAHALTNFGSVDFSSAGARNTANHHGTISDSAWSDEEIIMVKGRRVIAQPSELSGSGDSFSVQWLGS